MKTTTKEKRRCPRIETVNVVSYLLYDEKGVRIDQGKGRTINISQSGVLLETDKPLEGVYIVLMTIDLEGNRLKIKGFI